MDNQMMSFIAGKLRVTDQRAIAKSQEYLRVLKVKGWTLGEESKRVCCMELGCQKYGVSVDRDTCVRLSCCDNVKIYQTALATAKSILGITNVLGVKDVCIQSGVPECAERANGLMASLQSKMLASMPEQRRSLANFNRIEYIAAAVSIASRKKGVAKVDRKRLLGVVDLPDLELTRTVALFEQHLPELLADKKKEAKKEAAVAAGDDEDVDDAVIDDDDLDLDSAVDNPRLSGTKSVKNKVWKKSIIDSETKSKVNTSSSTTTNNVSDSLPSPKKLTIGTKKKASAGPDESEDDVKSLLQQSGIVAQTKTATINNTTSNGVVTRAKQQKTLSNGKTKHKDSSASDDNNDDSNNENAVVAKQPPASNQPRTSSTPAATSVVSSLAPTLHASTASSLIATVTAKKVATASSLSSKDGDGEKDDSKGSTSTVGSLFGTAPLSAPVIPVSRIKPVGRSPLKPSMLSSSRISTTASSARISLAANLTPAVASSAAITTKSTEPTTSTSAKDDESKPSTTINKHKDADTTDTKDTTTSTEIKKPYVNVFERLMAAGRTAPRSADIPPTNNTSGKSKKRKDPSSNTKRAPEPARKRSVAAVEKSNKKSRTAKKAAASSNSDDE